MTHFQGLTDEEVAARRSAGQGNTVSSGTSRTYWDESFRLILRQRWVDKLLMPT